MNSTSLHHCRTITQSVRENPLNSFFDRLSSAQLPNYNQIIQKPIDFETILKNLDHGDYKTIAEWYNDMLLVYQNALTYHQPDGVWHRVAEYCLADFKKRYHDIQTQSMQKWYELLNQKMVSLSELIGNSPVPQIIDPLIISVVKKAELMDLPSSSAIAELVETINKKINEQQFKVDILTILNKTQPELKIEGEEFTVDADTLNNTALNALILYSSSC